MKNLYLIMISILVMVCFAGVISVSYAIEEVKIGAIYPLTGAMSANGSECMRGIELAAELVNNKFEGIDLPLTETEGLPNLGGAKIKLIVIDDEGSPEKALNAAERLISQNVVAMIGCYQSSCASTASQAAERQQIPFVGPDVTSPTLTERGFKWFFRTTPTDVVFSEAFYTFLDELKEKKGKEEGKDIKRIAILCEDSLTGTDQIEIATRIAEERGYEVVAKITFATGTADLSSEVQKLKASKPDVLFTGIYVSDLILFIKTAKELDFNVDLVFDASGIADNTEIFTTLKKDTDFDIGYAAWALDLAGKKPVVGVVNKMYKDKYGADMTELTARSFTGAYVLFMAINNAGSTENVAIQKALQNLNLSNDQLIMPWPGVQFNEKGQNFKATPLLLQAKDMALNVIWPFNFASMEVVWPRPKWSDR